MQGATVAVKRGVVRGIQALNNLEPGLSSQIAKVDIVARHLDNLPNQKVADIISDANNSNLGTLVTTNYEKWKHYWINRTIKVGEDNLSTGEKLRAYGYPRSADAWKSAGSSIHKTNNKNSLKNNTDPLIPDPVTQYEIDVIDSQGNITTLRKDDPTVKWEDFFKDSGLDWEVHHVLPKSLFKSEGFAKWYEDVGHEIFDINAHTSVVRLEKVDGLRGVHDNHLMLNRILRQFFDNRYLEALRINKNDRLLASIDFDNEIQIVLPNLKKRIIAECLKKPTFTAAGVYNQLPVNNLLDNYNLALLLKP